MMQSIPYVSDVTKAVVAAPPRLLHNRAMQPRPHEWIVNRLKEIGKTQVGLASAMKLAGSRVTEIVKGERQVKSQELMPLANYLELSTDDVMRRLGGGIDDLTPPQPPAPWSDGFVAKPIDIPQEGELRRDLPVLGHAVGGEDGAFEMNGQLYEMVSRPSYLATVRNAYAVYMTGTSMEPALSSGWLLHVHPTKPPQAGNFVVVQLHNPDDPAPLCFVKQFIRRTATKLVCRQYNPAQELEWPLEQVIAVHRVVGIADM